MKVKIEKQQDGAFRSVVFKNVTYGDTHVLLHALENYPSPDAAKMAEALRKEMVQESMVVPGT